MSTPLAGVLGDDTRVSGSKATPAHPAPNNAGPALLLVVLLLVVGISIFVGAPALQRMQAATGCSSVVGESLQAASDCR
jgi:hypothetical protein